MWGAAGVRLGDSTPRPQSPGNMGEREKSSNRHSTYRSCSRPSFCFPKINTPQRVPEHAHLHHCYRGARPWHHPHLPATSLPPQSAVLYPLGGGHTIPSPVRTLQTQGALPEAKAAKASETLAPHTPLSPCSAPNNEVHKHLDTSNPKIN